MIQIRPALIIIERQDTNRGGRVFHCIRVVKK